MDVAAGARRFHTGKAPIVAIGCNAFKVVLFTICAVRHDDAESFKVLGLVVAAIRAGSLSLLCAVSHVGNAEAEGGTYQGQALGSGRTVGYFRTVVVEASTKEEGHRVTNKANQGRPHTGGPCGAQDVPSQSLGSRGTASRNEAGC